MLDRFFSLKPVQFLIMFFCILLFSIIILVFVNSSLFLLTMLFGKVVVSIILTILTLGTLLLLTWYITYKV